MFIREHQKQWPVTMMCKELHVSASGYYAWTKRPECEPTEEERALLLKMRDIHTKTKHTTGSRRMRHLLRLENIVASRHRIRRLMREDGMRVVRTPRRLHPKSACTAATRVAPNVLDRNFCATEPNQKWCADFTYIATRMGFVYLAVVMDLFSRRIIGWHVADTMSDTLTITALTQAWKSRGMPSGVLMHSDRGSQYTSDDYWATLNDCGAVVSMSRKGNPYDNAVVESFFATLKIEGLQKTRFRDLEHVQMVAWQYIENAYHRQRLHSTLDYITPVQCERAFFEEQRLTMQGV